MSKYNLSLLNYFCCIVLALLLSLDTSGQDFSNMKGQKPVQMRGSLQAGTNMYTASGIADRRQPFSYLVNGNASFNIYGVEIPFSIAYTGKQSAFSQPFNQFGISPKYKWIQAHLGYRNLEYSPYTLGGHTLLGAGVELTPGKWRVGFMYGRLNAATKVDTLSRSLVPYSFSRKATAVKLGYGTDRSFVEFSYLSAHDDSTSVTGIPSKVYIPPASNYVIGNNIRLSIGKHFVYEAQGAVSIYTRDVNSPYSLDNTNNTTIKNFKKYFNLNGTTEYYTAFAASLGYQGNMAGLKVSFKQIMPDFQSMGTYFINSDVQSWTLDPNVRLFKNRLRLSGNVGFQRDNLLKQKRSTNNRVISALNMNVGITKNLTLDGTYSNFSNDQRPNTVLYPDSIRIVQSTRNIMVSPRYTIAKPSTIQMFSVSYNINTLNDLNQVMTSSSRVDRSIDTKQYFLNYSVTFPKSNFGVFANVNRTSLASQTLNSTFQGYSLGGFASLAKKKLMLNMYNSLINGTSTTGDTRTITSTGAISYQVFKKQVLRTSMYYTNFKPEAGSARTPFSEFRNELSYLINF